MFYLEGKHIEKARARRRSRHKEQESSDDDSNVAYVDDAVDTAREEREFQVHILIKQLPINSCIRNSYWINKKKEKREKRKDKSK